MTETELKVRCAEHKGPRPVRQPAGTLAARRLRFEHARIRAVGANVARLCVVAARDADQLAENAAERPTDDIAGLIRREIERARRAEMEAKSVEFERQRVEHSTRLLRRQAARCVRAGPPEWQSVVSRSVAGEPPGIYYWTSWIVGITVWSSSTLIFSCGIHFRTSTRSVGCTAPSLAFGPVQ